MVKKKARLNEISLHRKYGYVPLCINAKIKLNKSQSFFQIHTSKKYGWTQFAHLDI